jgi:hypothetical protein
LTIFTFSKETLNHNDPRTDKKPVYENSYCG